VATDQEIRDAGFKYIPEQQYLKYPFQLPQNQEPVTNSGIVNTNAFMNSGGGGGGALQAGDINYKDFASAGFDAYAKRQPTPLVDDLYQSKLDKTFMGFPSYQTGQLTGADMGEYIGSGTDIPLELTTAGKLQNIAGNITGGIQNLANKAGGFGPISAILSKMDRFNTLPELDQQFIKQSMGYKGPTVFGENTGGNYVDPFGVNVRSAFGNYAEKVKDDYSSLEKSLTGRLSEKYGVQFNPETGMFENPDDIEAAEKANKMTNMMRQKYIFRQQQLKQQAFNETIAEKKAKEIERIKNLGKGGYDPAVHGETNYGQGSDGQQSYSGDSIGAGNLGFGVGATTGGPVSNRTGRGRTDYMDGGLASIL